MSPRMNRLRYWDIRLLAGILCLMMGLTAALSGALLGQVARQNYEEELKTPAPFDPLAPNGYSYVRLQYLTGIFVENVKSTDRYCFGFDFMFRPYIIAVRGELPKELQELMDYTYSDGDQTPPDPVDVCGYGEAIKTELMGYARESYSLMWEETQLPMTMEEMSGIVGDYYLDTVPRTFLKQYPMALLFYAVPILLLACSFLCLLSYVRRIRAQSRRLRGHDEDLAAADRELMEASEYRKRTRIYLTEHFIVSGSCQFEVVPYERLRQVEYQAGVVIGVTGDGYAHILAGGRRCRRLGELLVQDIKGRMAECYAEHYDE